MKKMLLAGTALLTLVSGSAMAADLSRPAPQVYTKAPMMAPLFTWTGFYLGGNLGGAWAHSTVTDIFFPALNFGAGNNNGVFIAGGQVGGNYQIGNFVLGVEGTFDWAANQNNTSTGTVLPGGLGTIQVTSNNTWISTLAGRVGVAYDRVLFYGKGGGAWVGNNGFTVTNVTTGASVTGSSNNNTTGWLAGAGIEWAFANNWTVKFEYDYIGLSARTFTIPTGVLAGDTFTTGSNNIQMVTAGVNFLFNMH
jgi:outer membrane immunogenic protein